MKHRKLLIFGLPIMSLLLVIGAVPVYARGDTGTDTTEASQSTSAGSSTSSSDTEVKTTEVKKTELQKEVEKKTEDKVRAQGAELLAELKKDNKDSKTADELKKTCEQRKTGLQTKVTNIVKNAQKHQDNINSVFDMVVAYQKNSNLTISNWATLVNTATAAKTQSQTIVTALSGLKPTIDCNSGTVASDVANFKAATAQARTDLTTYRTAVKALLTAAETAKGGQQ